MSELHKALLEVQKELKPVKRTSDNPFFKSKYADLEAVMEAVLPVLSKHGLISVQTTEVATDGSPILVQSIIHAETGGIIVARFPVIAKDSTDPQKVIAGLTYMRRAVLSTICGLSAQDDDGNSASKPGEHPQLKALKTLSMKDEEKPKGAEVSVKILGITRDTKSGVFSIKTANGVMHTDKEVLAVIARDNIGKSPIIQYTVNPDMETIVLDIIPDSF